LFSTVPLLYYLVSGVKLAGISEKVFDGRSCYSAVPQHRPHIGFSAVDDCFIVASFRIKGFITSVSWPIVRVADGYSNFVVDFTAARAFEHLEPHETRPDMHSLIETGFISLLRVVVPQGEIFFADLPPKDMTN
jgi:hypothetical protein